MKFVVAPKGNKTKLPATISCNISAIILIVVAGLDGRVEAKYMMLFFILALITLDATLFYLFRWTAAMIYFNSEQIICKFLGFPFRSISYKEIQEYGVVWIRTIQYIYISKKEFTDLQRTTRRAFDLFRKTTDVVVVEFRDEILDFLKDKVNTEAKRYNGEDRVN